MDTLICTTTESGTIEYRLNKEIHRTDGPAIIWPCGSEYWVQHGQTHREGGPAIICSDGYRAWYYRGKLHRTDGPAKIRPDGTEEYWLKNKRVDIMVHFLQRK